MISWVKPPLREAVGTLPATLAALAVHSAERNESGVLDPGGTTFTVYDTLISC